MDQDEGSHQRVTMLTPSSQTPRPASRTVRNKCLLFPHPECRMTTGMQSAGGGGWSRA